MQMSPQPAGVCRPETHVPKPLCLSGEGGQSLCRLPSPERTHGWARNDTASRWGRAAKHRRRGWERGRRCVWARGPVGMDEGNRVSGACPHTTRAHCPPDAFVPTDPTMGLLGKFYGLQNSTGFCKISLAYIKNICIIKYLRPTKMYQE